MKRCPFKFCRFDAYYENNVNVRSYRSSEHKQIFKVIEHTANEYKINNN